MKNDPDSEGATPLKVVEADQVAGYEGFRLGAGQELLAPPPPRGESHARVSATGLLAL